jgi:hypothetical protein
MMVPKQGVSFERYETWGRSKTGEDAVQVIRVKKWSSAGHKNGRDRVESKGSRDGGGSPETTDTGGGE